MSVLKLVFRRNFLCFWDRFWTYSREFLCMRRNFLLCGSFIFLGLSTAADACWRKSNRLISRRALTNSKYILCGLHNAKPGFPFSHFALGIHIFLQGAAAHYKYGWLFLMGVWKSHRKTYAKNAEWTKIFWLAPIPSSAFRQKAQSAISSLSQRMPASMPSPQELC